MGLFKGTLYHFIKIEGMNVESLRITDTYRYLGIDMGVNWDDTEKITPKLERRLNLLRKSALTPSAKLYGLRTIIVPSLYHSLSLSKTTNGLLKRMDVVIRRFVRRVLHLPHDTPLVFSMLINPTAG